MTNEELLFSRFAEPAIIFQFTENDITENDGTCSVKTIKINNKYLPELGMNMDKKEFEQMDTLASFDTSNLRKYLTAVRDCIRTGEETTCDTWRRLISNCCGPDRICIRSRFILLEDGSIYEGIRNITAERRRLDNLKESERRFKIASDQINIYYWEYTVATKEMRPCFRCMRDLGLPALVKNYPEPAIEAGIFPPDYADMYRDWHKQIANGVKELEAEIPLTVGRVPFRVRYTTEFDADGKPYKAYGSATLISEAEKKNTRISNAIIEALAKNYSVLLLIDLHEGTLKVVRREEDCDINFLVDGSLDENIELVIRKYGLDENGEFARLKDSDYFRNVYLKGKDKGEFTFKRLDGIHWARLSYYVAEKIDGTPSSLIVTCAELDDLSAKKLEADKLIAQQKEQLEKQQEELLKAVASANRANRAKSDFLARMSHEIRTPMNAIMGMDEMIIKTSDDENIKSYARDVYGAAESLLGIINEILDFSKIESGKMELIEDEVQFGNFFNNLYSMFALRAEDKDLALVFEVNPDIPTSVMADEVHIRQILTNLLSNAIKYTDSGTITLRAGKLEETGERVRIRFEISDTGRGIKEEDMKHLFEAFERIDEKNSRDIEGSGLGMSIVAGILKLYSSKLETHSVFGEGSTFSFVLDLKLCDPAPMGDFRSIEPVQKETNERELFTKKGGSILVVDDNAVNLKVITVMLKGTEMSITPVTGGEIALRATKQKKYDIIFLDHYMPGMDGIETLQKLKEQTDGKNAQTPVIALTANAIKGADRMYIESGFTDVVYKPATQKDLNQALWKYVKP